MSLFEASRLSRSASAVIGWGVWDVKVMVNLKGGLVESEIVDGARRFTASVWGRFLRVKKKTSLRVVPQKRGGCSEVGKSPMRGMMEYFPESRKSTMMSSEDGIV